MKYAGRAGHNPLCEGANAIVNEVIEDRKIFSASKKYLSLTNTFIDVTPAPVAGQNNDLSYGIKMANDSKVDIFYSVHLNKAYDVYEGMIGCEVWLHDSDSKLVPQATRILKNLEKLGFKNRGIKFSTHLVELSQTKMPAMIIECFFIEATEDVELYRNIGADAIGKAIAEGLQGQEIKPTQENNYCIEFKKWYNKTTQTNAPLVENNIYDSNTEKAYQTLGKLLKGEY